MGLYLLSQKLPNSASSSFVCSYPAPPQSASQAALRKFVEAHNEQMKDWHSQLADKNIELRLPAHLDPNDFMEDASDESDEGDAHEDAAEPEDLVRHFSVSVLGVEDRHSVPNWILRLANDRVSWDSYPWGSYVWPTSYKHLRDANVKRWQPLYANDPTNETDTKSYSIEGFTWAFKGQLPVERLVPDETEARSRWWVSSRAYFDGRSFEDEQIPRHLNRNNYFEVPSEMYREFEEQRRGHQQMKETNDDMYEKITSGFQSYQGVSSSFHTLANNNSLFNMATPSNWQTPNQSNWLSPSNWQTPNPSYLGTPNSQPPIPSQHGTSNWQNPMTSRRHDARILDSHMDSWIQILISERTENANWTLAKSGVYANKRWGSSLGDWSNKLG
nr:hypothetical protein [Tanacetum cinerariifolium]